MEGLPPFLFDTDDRHGSCLTVSADIDTAVTELAVRGRWSRRLALDTYTGIRKCLAEHPCAIIIDLHELDDSSAASPGMWIAATRAAAALHPPVQMVLCVPPETPLAVRLQRLGAALFMPVFADRGQARAAVRAKAPLTDRLQLTGLLPDPLSASAARDLVGVACDAWGMRELLYRGRSIISELAYNAVERAGTDMAVTVWRRGRGMHLSVRDGDSRLPRLLPAARTEDTRPNDLRGQGLRIVDAASDAWGAMATRDGKVVWATLRARERPGRVTGPGGPR